MYFLVVVPLKERVGENLYYSKNTKIERNGEINEEISKINSIIYETLKKVNKDDIMFFWWYLNKKFKN